MNAFCFKLSAGARWIVCGSKARSLKSAKQLASRLGCERLLVDDPFGNYYGFTNLGCGWNEDARDPFNVVPTSLIVKQENGRVDKKKTLSLLEAMQIEF